MVSLLVREPVAAVEQLLPAEPVVRHVAGLPADQVVRHDVQLTPDRSLRYFGRGAKYCYDGARTHEPHAGPRKQHRELSPLRPGVWRAPSRTLRSSYSAQLCAAGDLNPAWRSVDNVWSATVGVYARLSQATIYRPKMCIHIPKQSASCDTCITLPDRVSDSGVTSGRPAPSPRFFFLSTDR